MVRMKAVSFRGKEKFGCSSGSNCIREGMDDDEKEMLIVFVLFYLIGPLPEGENFV